MVKSIIEQALERIKAEEDKKKKKKPALVLPKEKRLMYYSGWHKDDKPANKEKVEKQEKLGE